MVLGFEGLGFRGSLWQRMMTLAFHVCWGGLEAPLIQ